MNKSTNVTFILFDKTTLTGEFIVMQQRMSTSCMLIPCIWVQLYCTLKHFSVILVITSCIICACTCCLNLFRYASCWAGVIVPDIMMIWWLKIKWWWWLPVLSSFYWYFTWFINLRKKFFNWQFVTIPSVIRKFTSTSSIGENCSTIINHHHNHHSKWWHLN